MIMNRMVEMSTDRPSRFGVHVRRAIEANRPYLVYS